MLPLIDFFDNRPTTIYTDPNAPFLLKHGNKILHKGSFESCQKELKKQDRNRRAVCRIVYDPPYIFRQIGSGRGMC